MVNGLTELSSSVPLDRQSIIDIQKDIQPFTVATTKLRETINKVKTGKSYILMRQYSYTSIATYTTRPYVCMFRYLTVL